MESISESIKNLNIDQTDIEFDKNFYSMMNKLSEYDSHLPQIDKVFTYGTSGYRYKENELDRVN